MVRLSGLAALVAMGCSSVVTAMEWNTFDGPGFPSCYNVTEVKDPKTVEEAAAMVKEAAAAGKLVRAAGKGHMWYDTQCSDDETVIIRTEGLGRIYDLDLAGGSVMIEGGVTFFTLAQYLHDRGASVNYALVNWNISLGGSIAMGAHRSSLREDAMVGAAAQELHIIDGNGDIRIVKRDANDDDWLAASTSLGLLGIIARIKMSVYPDTKLYAMQKTLEEKDVFEGDIEALIAPYATANLWWWPHKRKFHQRYYDVVDINSTTQQAFQNTFSVTKLEAEAIKAIFNSGKIAFTSNMIGEEILFSQWEKPNFREKTTQEPLTEWPVYGWNYDVLIGGLYPDQTPQWENGLRGYTLELAFPMTQANAVLKRIRALFDEEIWKVKPVTSTYRSGINIKFGKAYFDLLGQGTYNTADGADWSRGVIMFDWPSFRPTWGDNKRYNEEFYHRVAKVLIDEFPCRPHWTKNTREVLKQGTKHLDPNHIARFKAVRQKFDPKGMFRSVVGEIIGVY
ncbi:hypothetical protein MCOR27_000128 [Pyricularia oryzae]|uniref:D-arabinono-1,4-lactone oxidase n=4 Tax=Pyricularia TaxID=48558 RepID=A0ABQ8NLK8_PYRGI|nr:uncharacterized protein MGG_02420 [Pyricularia oryzae 70-15]ELQ43444.1 hypothetical protein OOU_Y34scaffold00151g12 [Pyricularia oryzae Y34]KAH8842638.1 hypothetical protein MCOR01_006534 [Pyricularia oryzae]KAI6298969.1 hypothetical protein MCOR33_005024 [Pyricularia grisea]EHA56595.1 hypothetical protein MGG_02420 [Pyricularia oryzae 70-15]KAH9435887.1 hypothetical protein MCOR02_004799 [Pyricularia oryzae]